MSQVPYNPYAKKAKTTAATTTTNPYKSTKRKDPPIQNPVPPSISSATFSQAFASLEDDPKYQSSSSSFSSSRETKNNPQHAQECAEQRALDLQEAIMGEGAADRDHHVLLQPHVLYVSTKQRGNEVLKYIRNVPFAFSKMVPDYIMSSTTCALFLSIKYHQLYPNYIHRRLGELRTDFKLRILLVLVDVEDNANILAFLNKLAVTNNMTLILAWSEQEAARYLETYKALDGKDASSIQKRESTNFQDQNADFMTACKPVNKTDANNLLNHFSTIKAVAMASPDELALCEGLGPIKVKKLYEALHKPFSKLQARDRKRKAAAMSDSAVQGNNDKVDKGNDNNSSENQILETGI